MKTAALVFSTVLFGALLFAVPSLARRFQILPEKAERDALGVRLPSRE
ncbi:MAG: hypothetical protein FWH34_05675 [Desulfovibrionaceae bacterium]|nr:hypothetical protein [Desulfovibrionaceae bacterium]